MKILFVRQARRSILSTENESPVNSSMILMASKNVQKPQLFFSETIDNSAKTPFMPIITEKPNSLKPLAIMLCATEQGTEYYSHPYQYELEHWTPDLKALSVPVEPVVPPPLDEVPLVMVDTVEALQQTVQELKLATHIAVDVEHHSFRSYLGLTSLLQVSTRSKDYIIDPIKLRGKLTSLNEVFTHPKITKVLHGADYDVLWLQRDCGLYLVNLFDTHLACVVLEFHQRSLAYLLNVFCNCSFLRPLPRNFIEYARQDTHYLLYIHDLLHNLLLERANGATNLLQAVYDRSTALCLTRYEKPVVSEDSYLQLYNRSRKTFNNQQLHALQRLYLWRDKTAREHDESVDFVVPRHMLLHIAEVLPREVQGILACCNPIPPLVKTELLTLHSILRDAREQPALKTLERRLDVTPTVAASSSSTRCLHDLSSLHDSGSLPCLLDGTATGSLSESLFGDRLIDEEVIVCRKPSSDLLSGHQGFLSPYDRYRLYVDSKVKLPVFEGDDVKTSVQKPSVQKTSTSSKQVTEDDRISRVRDHFLSLAQITPPPARASRPMDADDLRVQRLLAETRDLLRKK
ncbi:hypothetical protein HAZT_HAZT003702 [Hyalella azteca]|uniref:HRDC domain-containing protein n=1 Tax=Hyalella azteca TaxID=294128 RepID=A0A6A0H0X2_HYAAZ|nr:hypothetical protein HAZT_HAZT003702 [Hyalella azteca]